MGLPADFASLALDRKRLCVSVRAPRTLEAYAMDFRLFSAWCADNQCQPLPASQDSLAYFVLDELRRGRKITTVTRHVTSICYAHRQAGFPSPCVDGEIGRLLLGTQRMRAEQPRQKTPISVEDLRRICAQPTVGVTATRDRAILLFGFASALRRSNIAALDLTDLTFSARGVVVHVRKEKQDQLGVGRLLGVTTGEHETCPVKALEDWMVFRGRDEGPLFKRIRNRALIGRMHPNRISLVVKGLMASLGLDPSVFGAHSMRAGHVTESVANGVDHLVIMRQTGHRSIASLQRYFRERDPFRSNSCAALGL